MSRAVGSITCRFGIAVLGSMATGSRIQRTMFSGVFASSPAMMLRSATPVSGGPTFPCAPVTPRISWHDPQKSYAERVVENRALQVAIMSDVKKYGYRRDV